MTSTSLKNQPLNFGRESLTFTFSQLNAKSNEAEKCKSKSQNNLNVIKRATFTECKKAIDNAADLKELHQVWESIKRSKLYNDEVLMAWYDLKYNLIGNI